MTEFYIYTSATRLFITFVIGVLTFSQTLSIVLLFYQYNLKKMDMFRMALEISVLIVVIISALLQGQTVIGFSRGLVIYGGYDFIRIVIYIFITFLVGIITFNHKKLTNIDVLSSTVVILPLAEKFLGKLYPVLFLTSLIVLLIRSLINSFYSINSIRSNISSLSVINAIDSLQTAVLFSDNDGQILLINNKMQKLMFDITDKIYRNSNEFYQDIIEKDNRLTIKKIELDSKVVYLLPDNSAWMFSKSDIEFRFKKYLQVSATNVSKLWSLTEQLEDQKKELLEKSINLKETIANLHILSKEKELDRARIKAHDVLGQKLSILLRIIQNQQDLDYKVLKELSENLLAELKSDTLESQPEEELASIKNIFSAIGVEVLFDGKLPKRDKYSRLFVDIIKEGCTNAVRHGFANEIKIESVRENNADILTITNEGFITEKPINKGSGLNNIKNKVNALGGIMEIIASPTFTLTVVIPGGDDNV